MLKGFNAFQITAFFAAFPFLLAWLWSTADFPGVGALKWVAGVAYVIFFFIMTACTWAGIDTLD